MKANSYRQFSNLFTRRLNKVFTPEMFARFRFMLIFNGCNGDVFEGGVFERFKPVVEQFGSEVQIKAYNELQQLMNDNPEFTEQMNDIETRKFLR